MSKKLFFIAVTAFFLLFKVEAQVITAGVVTGTISACAGTASASPNIQQFSVSGTALTTSITATAPTGFEISLLKLNNFSNTVTISQSGGVVNNVMVYIRSSVSAPPGNSLGSVLLTSTGAITQSIPVSGTVHTLPVVNTVTDQVETNGGLVNAIKFSGTASSFSWINDSPEIGLPVSGIGNIASFNAVNNTDSSITAKVTVTPSNKTSFAYITNENDNTVSVINLALNLVIAVIPIVDTSGHPTVPAGIVASPDGSRVYVLNKDVKAGSVINTLTNKVVATFPLEPYPTGACVSPDGTKLYITSLVGNDVSIISTANNNLITKIPVGNYPTGIAISADGSKLYVSNQNSGTLSIVNTSTNRVISTITVGQFPEAIAVNANNTRVYVANSGNNLISVVNPATASVIASISASGDPYGLCLNKDGSRLYVTNVTPNTMTVFNTLTNTLVATVPVGSTPQGISISQDDRYVYVADANSNTVSVVNTSSNTVTTTIAVGGHPYSFGNFIANVEGCTGTPVSFNVKVNPTPIIVATGSLSALSTTYGTASSPTSFTLSGTNLTSGILVTPPSGFEVSVNGSIFYNTVTIGTTGTVSPTVIYLRLSAVTAIGTYAGNVTLSSKGAVNVNIATSLSTVIKDINDALSNIAISVGTLSPSFSPAATSYTASVGNTVSSLTVTPLASDTSSRIKVNGVAQASGNTSAFLPLKVGSNIVTVMVTAQDGIDIRNYTLNITRSASSNADLSGLAISNGTLSPVFSTVNLNYIATVDNSDSTLTVTPLLTDTTAKVSVNGTALKSGLIFTAIPLKVGSNVVTILVVAQDGITTKSYSVAVMRAAPTFTLPVTDFTISTISASCRGSNNGSININAAQTLNYIAIITGDSTSKPYAFTDSLNVSDLSAGTYAVCITIAGQSNYKQCYDAVITQPADLSVYSTINDKDNSITLALSGGRQYFINFNNKLYITTGTFITLPLTEGNNSLTVTTDKFCQGIVQKLFNISGKIIPYPVPFQTILNLSIGNTTIGSVAVDVYNVQNGTKVYAKQYKNQSGVIQLDVSELKDGVYTLHLFMDNLEKVFKIIKK